MTYEYRMLTPEERAALVKQRLAQGYPPHPPLHPVRAHMYCLLTAACYEHKCHMTASQRRRELLEAYFEQFTLKGDEIVGWVALPNHYHLPARVAELAGLTQIFRVVHGRLSRKWNLEDHTPGRKVWYCHSDRAIRSEGHYYTTLNHIHYNAVNHGWTASPYDWAESSVGWYVEHFGREWLRDLWAAYPVREYGRGWDDFVEH
jgi:putative transposase